MLRAISEMIGEVVAREVKEALSPAATYLKRLSLGSVLILVSSIAWGLGLFFGATALFMIFADYPSLAWAGLWTSLIMVGVAFILTLIGALMIRQPR